MKIINFISGKDLGGPKQSFLLYTEALEGLGHSVTNVIRKGAQIKPILKSNGSRVSEVQYFRTPFEILNRPAINSIANVMVPETPDLIFCHKPMDIKTIAQATNNNVPILAIIHGFSDKYLEGATALIAVSEKVKQFLIERNVKKPIYVIPNVVKIDTEPEYRDLPEVPLIGAMGVFRRKKGFHIFIKALAILKKDGVNFNAVIAGRGQLYPYLMYLRYRLGLTDILNFRSWVSNDDRDSFVDSIDLYVLPSRTETFGMVVVEAMARMKRVIATKCGGPEEIITNGVNGYLVEKQSPEDLARQLKYIIDNPDKSRGIARSAYITAKEKYTIPSINQNLTTLINKYGN